MSTANADRLMVSGDENRFGRTTVAIGLAFGLAALTAATGCRRETKLPSSAGTGPNPVLPEPSRSLVPTVNIAPARGWAAGEKPAPADGTMVTPYATGLSHPRWLYVLPNGDVLVAETNAPPKPEDYKGVRGWMMKRTMKKAGAGTPSANRISLLRDANGDGLAESQITFLEGLRSPFGMVLVDDQLYVAETDALVRFPYKTGDTRITASGAKVVDLPGGPLNHHWTKTVTASQDGTKLYVSVGSNSNIGENGMAAEEGRAAIWEVDPKTGAHRIFASGLRNPIGLATHPVSGQLWTTVNERDELGGDLVPDYMTQVRDGGFYGWPYSYFGQHVDPRVKPQRPDLVSQAIRPDYALGAHAAAMGLAFGPAAALPAQFQSGAFVAQHGSWNRVPLSGYKVVFVPFEGTMPSGAPPVDLLMGFVDDAGKARGRPVGVVVDKGGALLVADDVGNVVWRVSAGRDSGTTKTARADDPPLRGVQAQKPLAAGEVQP